MRAALAFVRRLLSSFRRERWNREFSEEIESCIEMDVADQVRAGVPEQEARRQARLRFGGSARAAESYRDRKTLPFIETTIQDLRYGYRSLCSAPAFALVAVLSLALGVGANTAIFALVNSLLLKPLPVERPEELVQLRIRHRGETPGQQTFTTFTNPLWEAIRDRGDLFQRVAAYGGHQMNLSGGGRSRMVKSQYVSGDYFPMLGIQPAAGRMISKHDDYRGCPAIAVLGHDFWMAEYGGRGDLSEIKLSVEGQPVEVVGVAQRGFHGSEVGSAVHLYMPLCRGRDLDHRSAWWLHITARVKREMPESQLKAALESASPAVFGATVPPGYRPPDQARYRDRLLYAVAGAKGESYLRSQYAQPLMILMAGVGLVLLIACANVANLLLARASARQRELAIRLALGSSRRRLVRQLLTESLLIAFSGAVLGCAIAYLGTSALIGSLSTSSESVLLNLVPDWRMLVFTVSVAVLTAFVFGLAPALRASGFGPEQSLKPVGRGVIEGHSRSSAGSVFVCAQVALSVVLLVGAGLLFSTFLRLSTSDPGFDPNGLLIVRGNLESSKAARARPRTAVAEMLEHLRSTPGVTSVSASDVVPITNSIFNDEVYAEGFTPKSREDAVVYFNNISSGYFRTMRTPMLAGRDFQSSDTVGARLVAIVNEALARKLYGTTEVLGRTFETRGPAAAQRYEIIGLAANSKYYELREKVQPTAFIAVSQNPPDRSIAFEVRTAGAPASVENAVARSLAAYDPGLTFELFPLLTPLAESLHRERLMSNLSAVFGWLALILAAIGLYGLMSYNVAQRRGEIGIRMALGAEGREVLWMVMRRAGIIVGAGLALGVPAALAASRALDSLLYGVSGTDPVVIGAAVFVLCFAAATASYFPARRASRVDPMSALREE